MNPSRRLLRSVALSLPLVLATSVAVAEPPVEEYRKGDRSVVALNVLPPGQGRYLNGAELAIAQAGGPQPEQNTNQIEMYDKMIDAAPGITPDRLDNFFKDASFGVQEDKIARAYSPREGVEVLRDDPYHVPHVYGATRSDTMFGAGYVSAEDRLFMMDVLRHVGRGRSSELLGASEENLAMDRAAYKASGYSEEEFEKMIARLEKLDPVLGPIVIQDVQDFTDGVNQYIDEARTNPSKLPGEYEALQVFPEDWKPTDTAAVASLIGSRLGVGGGGELENAAFLHALMRGHKKTQANKVFRDFRNLDDPEAPVTTKKRFPYLTNLGRVKGRSIAMPDRAVAVARSANRAVTHVTGPFGPIDLSFSGAMSNALLVGRKLSNTGRPLTVFGPQTGYFSPQILMEIDLHGPGIAARGVGFPGISLYALLGRGAGYAWSATSASGDQVDTFAERLCEPGSEKPTQESDHYKKDGKCVPMYERTDTWLAKPTAGGVPDPGAESVVVRNTTMRTDNGIVQTRGTVDGKPVAFVEQRTSFKKEVDSALTYVEIQDPDKIRGPRDFQKAFAKFSFSFNWFYLDGEDISFILGGYYPRRTEGVSRSLPTWGTDRWDWKKGRLGFRDLPKATNPAQGYMTSWNNKQAPGWGASDSNFSYGTVYRSQLLDARIKEHKRRGKVSLVDLANAMGDAATADLRGERVLPYMLEVVGRPGKKELADAASLLRRWVRAGTNRRDRSGDGHYEHSSAIALMDRWWDPALDAIFKPRLRGATDNVPVGRDNEPGPLGSAYQSGWYSHANKDLRTVLGKRVRGKYSLRYCGKGELRICRAMLRDSLAQAIRSLTEEFGSDPSKWDADEDKDKIRFRAIGIQGQDPIRWQNRPTFQQALEFRRPRS